MTLDIDADAPVIEQEAERGRGVPLWRQIDQDLSNEIASGGWQPGERLPTELILAERFNVNRHTVRRAIQSLVQRGLLRVEQGRGTYVQDGVIDYQIGRRTRFAENMLRSRREPSGEILSNGAVLPPMAVARQLGIHPRTPVEMAEVLSAGGGMPVSVSTVYFPGRRFAGAGRAMSETRSLPETFKRFGIHDYERTTSRITARLPTADEARLLKQPANRPILQSESLEVDPDGKPIAVIITRFAGDRVQVIFDTADSAA